MTTAENIALWRKATRSYQSRERTHTRIFGTPLSGKEQKPKRQKPPTSREKRAIARLQRFLASPEASEAQKFIRLTGGSGVRIAAEFSDVEENRFDHLLFTERGLELDTPVGHGSVSFVPISPREAILRFREGIWNCEPKDTVQFIRDKLNGYAEEIRTETALFARGWEEEKQNEEEYKASRRQIVYSDLAIEDD